MRTDSIAAQAKQTNKHREKQDDVSDEEDGDVELVALGVDHYALYHNNVPGGAELEIGKTRWSKVLGTANSPA